VIKRASRIRFRIWREKRWRLVSIGRRAKEKKDFTRAILRVLKSDAEMYGDGEKDTRYVDGSKGEAYSGS